MEMVGSGEKITGEELFGRYTVGERNFAFIHLDHGNCILEGADLSGINLMAAYLREGSFLGTNLSKACLIGAVLPAHMGEANLSEADLTGAMLQGVYLKGANLYGCILRRANLRDAILQNTNLLYANWESAILIDTDFTGAEHFSMIYPGGEGTENGYDVHGAILWDTIMPDGSIVDTFTIACDTI